MLKAATLILDDVTAINCALPLSGVDLTIRNSHFEGNQGLQGSVITAGSGLQLLIENTVFRNNAATYGPVVYVASNTMPNIVDTNNVVYDGNIDACGTPIPYVSRPASFSPIFVPTVLPLLDPLSATLELKDVFGNTICFHPKSTTSLEVDVQSVTVNLVDGVAMFAGMSPVGF
jgi:hypothetical protein